jgi:hypothetical protein
VLLQRGVPIANDIDLFRSCGGRGLGLDGRPYLLFTPEQSRQMKTRLAERAQASQAQEKVASLGQR